MENTAQVIAKRKKRYPNGTLSAQGWRTLVALAESKFGKALSVSGTIDTDDGHWEFGVLEDFLSDIIPGRGKLWLYWESMSAVFDDQRGLDCVSWSLQKATKAQIVDFDRDATTLINLHLIPLVLESNPEPIEHAQELVVFIGHGRSEDWREIKDHLHDKHDIEVESYESGSRAGHTIRDILNDMIDRSSLAILVHTPEDEMVDGHFSARPNVIHETGLFQGSLGFSRVVVVRKHGTNTYSNLDGVQEIRYVNEVKETFGDLLAWIRREST